MLKMKQTKPVKTTHPTAAKTGGMAEADNNS